jgi:hypothetical protein
MENGNSRLFAANGKQKRQTNFRSFSANGKWKFVYLGRQTKNGNRRLLFRQRCPSMVICMNLLFPFYFPRILVFFLNNLPFFKRVFFVGKYPPFFPGGRGISADVLRK